MPRFGDRRTAALWLSGWIALWGVPARVDAVDMFWSNFRGDGSGGFSVANNWTESAPFSSPPPDSNDAAHFGMTTSALSPKTYTVTFTNDVINNRLAVEDDGVTFDLNGHLYTAANDAVAVAIGTVAGRSGRLTVIDGTLNLSAEADLEVGSVSGGSGVLAVGAGGLVRGAPELIVGVNGSGTLNVNNGGDVIAHSVTLGKSGGSAGAAAISGLGSSLRAGQIYIGKFAPASLNITSGGLVECSYAEIRMSPLNGPAAVTVTGANSKWISSSGLIVGVGVGGYGSLLIADGGQVEDVNGEIGFANGGTVTVDGPNSKWTHRGDLRVGHFPSGLVPPPIGTMNITGGGLVENLAPFASVEVGSQNGRGMVNVDGPNSRWINAADLKLGVFSFQDNILNIMGGGLVQNAHAFLGHDEFSRGTVNVSEAGSQWINKSITVGRVGAGSLNVFEGATVEAEQAFFGHFDGATGTVNVDGPTSRLTISDFDTTGLVIGFAGQGELNITGGAVVSSGAASIASGFSTSVGTVIVAGAGSTLALSRQLGIGVGLNPNVDRGAGTLRIQSLGIVSVAQDTVLGNGDLLSLEGGTLSTGRIRFIGTTQQFLWTSGTLHLGSIDTDLAVPNGGVLAPGIPLGKTQILGDLTLLAGATAQFEIGGTQRGVTYDYIELFGGATINDANLQLFLLNGFTPSGADAFTLLDGSNNATGSFANVANGQRLVTSDGLGSFRVNYGPGSPFGSSAIVLSAFQASLAGDFDFDGDVDGADFLIWQRGGSPNPLSAGDLAVWRTNFGAPFSASANSAAVPEPSTVSLTLAIVMAVGSRYRRHRTTPRVGTTH